MIKNEELREARSVGGRKGVDLRLKRAGDELDMERDDREEGVKDDSGFWPGGH
jgi:hypothetical protein